MQETEWGTQAHFLLMGQCVFSGAVQAHGEKPC